MRKFFITSWILVFCLGSLGATGSLPCASENGDVNGDGARDLSDAIAILANIFRGASEPVPFCTPPGPKPDNRCSDNNGDVNGDGVRDLSDAIAIIASIFRGEPGPVPFCGGSSAPLDPFEAAVDSELLPRDIVLSARGGPARFPARFVDSQGIATDFVEHEILFAPRDDDELAAFAARYNGVILSDTRPPPPLGLEVPDPPPELPPIYFRIHVDVATVPEDWVDAAGAINGLDDQHRFSSASAARLAALYAHERAAGARAVLNFLYKDNYMLHTSSEFMGTDALTLPEYQGSSAAGSNNATTFAAWQLVASHKSIGGVAVGIADGGFWLDGNGVFQGGNNGAGNDISFSKPSQYDFVGKDYLAGGTSQFGSGNPWNGTGVTSIVTGMIDNNIAAAGSGGQIASPALFNIDGTVELGWQAMNTSLAWGMSVHNMSYGLACNSGCGISIEDWQEHVDKMSGSMVVVASAGNGDAAGNGFDVVSNVYLPCILSHVVCVGALNGSAGNTRASYSNFGASVDIWAPTNITTQATPNSPSNTVTFGGTSASAPYVSGVAAMMRFMRGSLSSDQARQIMRDTAYTNSLDSNVTHYLDALDAVLMAANFTISTDTLEPSSLLFPTTVGEDFNYLDLTIHNAAEPDYYKVPVPVYSKLKLTLEYHRAGLGPIDLADFGDAEDFSVTSSPTGAVHTAGVVALGELLFKLSSAIPQGYNMRIELEPVDLAPDAFEPNEGIHVPVVNKGIYPATLHTAGDVDYYPFSFSLPPLPGAYYIFRLIESGLPVTVDLFKFQGGSYVPAGSFTGTEGDFTFGLNDSPGIYAARVTGPVTKYRFVLGCGDGLNELADSFIEKYWWFLDPLGPVIDEIMPLEQDIWVAVDADVMQERGVTLQGEGLFLEVYDAQFLQLGVSVNNGRGGQRAVVERGVSFERGAQLLLRIRQIDAAPRGEAVGFTLALG